MKKWHRGIMASRGKKKPKTESDERGIEPLFFFP